VNALISTTKSILRLSPSGAVTLLISDVANTGTYEELRFKDGVSLYLDRNFELIYGLANGSPDPFHYERASLGEVFTQVAQPDLAVLLLFNFAFIAAGTASFLRYDPR
jgi:hypothetical protein